MKRQINIDYIGVVRKEGDNYLYEERKITANQELIDKLQAIAEDDTKSILDMQACMHEVFGDAPKPVHRVALPDNYDTLFVLPAKYPDFIDEEQYENECQKVTESVCEEDAPEELKEHNRERKEEFLAAALRYIYATAFATAEAELAKDEGVVLYSHERLGWTGWKYSPSKDIVIALNTTFGMGACSDTYLDIKYKGRRLTAYSPLVQHFKADAFVLGMNTRSYLAERDNWTTLLRLICDICQRASQSSYDLAEKWIKDDVDTFVYGLREIVINPASVLATMCDNPSKIGYVYGVENMLQKDGDMLERYPVESTELFKARKLSDALHFTKSLREWADIYPSAAEAAEYIEEQCRLIMEELPTLIARQQQKIDKLNQRLDPITATWLEIKERLDEDPENAENLISQGRLDERIDTILNEIIARDSFIKSLQQCYATITKSGVLIENLKMI